MQNKIIIALVVFITLCVGGAVYQAHSFNKSLEDLRTQTKQHQDQLDAVNREIASSTESQKDVNPDMAFVQKVYNSLLTIQKAMQSQGSEQQVLP